MFINNPNLLLGFNLLYIKRSLDFIDPIVLVTYRFGLSAVILGAVLIYQKKNLLVNLKAGIILSGLAWIMYIAQTIGLKYTSATNSGFITGMFVVFVPLFSLLIFKKKTQLNKILAILISLLCALFAWTLGGEVFILNKAIGGLLIVAAIILSDLSIKNFKLKPQNNF